MGVLGCMAQNLHKDLLEEKVGVDIGLYPGLKHSSCTQFINEKDGTIDELQMLTDHARRDSVMKYAKVGVERKRRLMKRKVVYLDAKTLAKL